MSAVVRQNAAHYTKESSFLLGVSSSVWDCRLIRRWAENGRRESGTGQRLCFDTRIRELWTPEYLWHFTLQPYNGGAGRRVSARLESCFQPQGELLLADLLGCPSRDPGACDHRGNRARTRTSAV